MPTDKKEACVCVCVCVRERERDRERERLGGGGAFDSKTIDYMLLIPETQCLR